MRITKILFILLLCTNIFWSCTVDDLYEDEHIDQVEQIEQIEQIEQTELRSFTDDDDETVDTGKDGIQ